MMQLQLAEQNPQYGMVFTLTVRKALDTLAATLSEGEKVTDALVQADPTLQAGAREYASLYVGAFSYMCDMSRQSHKPKGLSIPQMRGVLNCLVAEGKRGAALEAKKAETLAGMSVLEKVANTSYMGEPGTKVVFNARVESCKVKDGSMGVTTIVKLVAENGQHAVWFASKDVTQHETSWNPTTGSQYETDLAVGMQVTVQGTIKAQNEWLGVKETVLTRCTLTPAAVAA